MEFGCGAAQGPNFQSSLCLEEDGALAAVEAEFDRRFGRASQGVPGSVDVSQQLSQQLTDVSGHASPCEHAGASPQPTIKRRGLSLADAAAGGGSPLARQSCAAAMYSAGNGTVNGANGANGVNGINGLNGGGGGEECELSGSYDASATSTPMSLNAKMRLASIRLSYADGIVGGGGGGGGLLSARASGTYEEDGGSGSLPVVAGPAVAPGAPAGARPEKVSPRIAAVSAVPSHRRSLG
ncbi:hypothetical protein TSOC_000802 [Tetrabaena socialis]|uniref:Uncharacterized protein n=1 Tax=Tetrabaena socialis TaxID=47790 RepID=A0A2J8AIE2_9CHLO|nr:hypothetical protein TSOC_000802 [Tetrabaena socialis]|eukprot:PNH12286.1 hypothetical protein TSOC_000802 [Tetrabaena socialis]